MTGMLESLVLALSYPLRLMATWIAVGCLKLFGVSVRADQTLIVLEADGIGLAVTDACSGIEQLFGLILVGGLFAFIMQRKTLFRLMHWATILPCVVLANAIRLVVTVLLTHMIGEVVLGNAWHLALGWAQTVLAVVLLWLFGKIIRDATHENHL